MTELEGFLAVYPESVQMTFLAAYERLRAMLTPVGELHYDATAAVCAGFSYTGDLKGLFVNLAAYSDHVTLVFAQGARLADPQKLLSGNGNQVRHRRLRSADDLLDPGIVALLHQAAIAAPCPASPIEYGTIVKVYEGPKRRPSSKDPRSASSR